MVPVLVVDGGPDGEGLAGALDFDPEIAEIQAEIVASRVLGASPTTQAIVAAGVDEGLEPDGDRTRTGSVRGGEVRLDVSRIIASVVAPLSNDRFGIPDPGPTDLFPGPSADRGVVVRVERPVAEKVAGRGGGALETGENEGKKACEKLREGKQFHGKRLNWAEPSENGRAGQGGNRRKFRRGMRENCSHFLLSWGWGMIALLGIVGAMGASAQQFISRLQEAFGGSGMGGGQGDNSGGSIGWICRGGLAWFFLVHEGSCIYDAADPETAPPDFLPILLFK